MIVRASSAAVDVLEEATRRFVGVASGVAAFVQSPGTIAFIAVDGHEVQGWCWGYVLARPDGTSMLYLHNLEVTESCRGRGIGRRLLRSFMEAGAQLGASKMFLVTGEENAAARGLYESMGAGLATQGPTVNYWFALPPTSSGSGDASSGEESSCNTHQRASMFVPMRDMLWNAFPEARARILAEEQSLLDEESPFPVVETYQLVSHCFHWEVFRPAMERGDQALLARCFAFVEQLLDTGDQEIMEAVSIRLGMPLGTGPEWRQAVAEGAGPLFRDVLEHHR
ncbi:GNAT family N-acetyltransferase [Dactylosporangium cerinum]|uniref:GNAT family N-acetyltransferase n=1 Tax=Dactylosporangium cerinum TaxID=1434730 RepID=A0ABV9W8D7_9ACTN